MSISSEYEIAKGSDMLKETFLNKTFLFSIQGFFQTNSEMANKMHQYCNELIKNSASKEMILVDLYSGVGTFGIINADLFKEIYLIEKDPSCVDAAKKNIKENKISNARIFEMDAKEIKKMDFPENIFMIIDPPRTGLHPKALKHIKSIKPKNILYISCNPKTLKRDLNELSECYTLKSFAFFDFFPQTEHIEVVVELQTQT